VELFRSEATVNMLVAQVLGYGIYTNQTQIIFLNFIHTNSYTFS